MVKRAIMVKPHNKLLSTCFAKEKGFLQRGLGKRFEINHIGSSAVPGLGGKNVLDMQLLASTKPAALKLVKKLKLLGYRYPGSGGDRWRIFFDRDTVYSKRKLHVHLHLMWKSSRKYKDHLLFRDYLRKHPEEALRYYKLKKTWARKAGMRGEKYRDAKTPYVTAVLRKARKEKLG